MFKKSGVFQAVAHVVQTFISTIVLGDSFNVPLRILLLNLLWLWLLFFPAYYLFLLLIVFFIVVFIIVVSFLCFYLQGFFSLVHHLDLHSLSLLLLSCVPPALPQCAAPVSDYLLVHVSASAWLCTFVLITQSISMNDSMQHDSLP